MDKLKELRSKYQVAVEKMQGIADSAEDAFSEEQQTEFDSLKAEAESLQKQIENQETLLKTQAEAERLANAPEAPVLDRQVPADDVVNEHVTAQKESSIIIPSNVKRWGGQLKAFKGEGADLRAYKAGMWLSAVKGSVRAIQWCTDHGMPMQWLNIATEGTNTAGGYLVYDELDNAIIDLKNEYGVFRRNARMVPMTSDVKNRPRRTGGLTAYFVGEGTAGTESTKAWDKVSLVAKKLMVLTKVANELNEDAIISIADDIISEIAYAFAYKEDECGFNGDGTSTYGGITGVRNSLISEACTGGVGTGAVTAGSGLTRYDTGYAYSNMALTDITAMMTKLPSYARMGAKFYMSPLIYDTIVGLIAAAGGNTIGSWQAGAVGQKFLGYPVELAESMPSTAAINQVAILFGRFDQAADYGDRRQSTISMSEHATVGDVSVFETDEIAIRGTERFDINVHDVGSSSTAGPVVGLITHTA